MTRVVRMTAPGGAEVLEITEVSVGEPGPGEVLVAQDVIGINFVDIYHRTGLYPAGPLPAVLGVEAMGRVAAVGAGVSGLSVGDRVAYAGLPPGSYAETRVMPAERLLVVPDGVNDEVAGASLLRGITAHMLLTRVWPLAAGQTVLVHAAAGGLGQILVRWVKRLGGVVVAVVGSEEKAERASALGVDHVIIHRRDDFVAEVVRITDGRGVDFAVDGVGGAVLARTFETVRPFGMVASVGRAGGPIPPVEVASLSGRRSIALACPSVLTHVADPVAYAESATAYFALAAEGEPLPIGLSVSFSDIARAHREVEAGTTTGSVMARV